MSAATNDWTRQRAPYGDYCHGCGGKIRAGGTRYSRALGGYATERICVPCWENDASEPRTAVAAAVATVLAAVLFMALLGCGMYAATHRDAPTAEPPAPSPTGERAEPQENVR